MDRLNTYSVLLRCPRYIHSGQEVSTGLGLGMALSFAPIFNNILDSSVWEEEYHVRLLWLTLLTLKDSDQVVRGYNAYKLARRANITPEEAQNALDILSSPDKKWPDQAFEGRRIEQVAGDSYRILNGAEYQTRMAQLLRRHYKTRKQREYRARQRAEQ